MFLPLSQAKMSCFSFTLFSFFSCKIREQEDISPAQERRAGTSGREGGVGEKG
jgi:hypothetical protein